MATVHIRYFAVLRDRRRADGQEEFELPEGDGLDWTVARIYAALFPPGDLPVAYAVNQVYVRGTHRPADGDEVAFIPPVGGG